MRVAFISENPPNEPMAFSGIPYFMSGVIETHVEAMEYVHTPIPDWQTVVSASPDEGIRVLREIGEFVSERLRHLSADAVICQGSTMIPFLETEKMVILWHDSTWHCLMQLDFEEFKFCHPLLWEWDCRVCERCDLIVFASDWVRDVTLNNYDIDPEKIRVLPFGPSVEALPEKEIQTLISERTREPCQLTFIGADWARKGLLTAHSLASQLNREGIPTVLNVIGVDDISRVTRTGSNGPNCTSQKIDLRSFNSIDLSLLRLRGSNWVNSVGFLRKEDLSERRRFYDILVRTHFLVHPAVFECFGIALIEANAFGVPVLATDEYGPRTIVRNGVNGQLFGPSNFVAHASRYVANHMHSYGRYQGLARKAFGEYQNRLNWDISVSKLIEFINSGLHLAGQGRTP